MNRENLTRDEIIEQIADYELEDHWCHDYTFSATDLLINGCRGLKNYTDDELNEIWDRYFADDDDDSE
jgi:hypothetical protein